MLGFLVTAAIVFHMFVRAKRLRKRDIVGRRRVIQLSALLMGGVVLWPGEQFTQRILNLPGAKQRFTGSHEVGSYSGNAFPTSSWVADHPRPIDVQTWRLTLGGAVTTPHEFSYHELASQTDELEATLDCTGGFYSIQRWRGIRVGRGLLADSALASDDSINS